MHRFYYSVNMHNIVIAYARKSKYFLWFLISLRQLIRLSTQGLLDGKSGIVVIGLDYSEATGTSISRSWLIPIKTVEQKATARFSSGCEGSSVRRQTANSLNCDYYTQSVKTVLVTWPFLCLPCPDSLTSLCGSLESPNLMRIYWPDQFCSIFFYF